MSEKGPTFRRARSHQDRDVLVPKHSQAQAMSVPEFLEEEGTGRHEGEDLRRIRARRPTPERFVKIEDRQDKFDLHLAKLESKVDTLLDLASRAEAERIRRSEQDAADRVRREQKEAAELERKRKHLIALISALGVAIAAVIAAVMQ